MVVLLILAILLAIAIPTFLGVTKSANDRAAQSNLNTALTNAKALYQAQGQSYTSTTVNTSTLFAASLHGVEPELTFGTTSSASQGNVSVQTSATDGNAVILAAYSKSSQNCWIVIDEPVAPDDHLQRSVGYDAVCQQPRRYGSEHRGSEHAGHDLRRGQG